MTIYKNLKIRTKYFIPVLIIAIGFLFVVVFGIKALNGTTKSMVSFIENDLAFLHALSNMYAQGLQSEQATRNILLNPSDKKAKDNYDKANTDFLNQLQIAKKTASNKGEAEKGINKIESLWTELNGLKLQVQNLAISGNSDEAKEFLNIKETKRWREFKEILLPMISGKEAEVESKKTQVQEESFASLKTMIIYSAVTMLISFLILFFAVNALVKPIKLLEEGANKVANGDTSVSVKIDSNDELGSLSQSFNLMVQNVKNSLEEVKHKSLIAEQSAKEAEQQKQISVEQEKYLTNCVKDMLVEMDKFSNGDLTVELNITGKDELITNLFNGFNKTVDKIRDTMLKVNEAVYAAASAANQISSSTEEMASGAQHQSTQTSEVAVAMEEMTKTILETTKNTETASIASKQAGEIAKNGDSIVKQTIRGIQNIEEVVSKSAETVYDLGKNSDQIGEIAQVIDDIADQTNLLALNAAIEAARAGEQGRGFAVVADEVRKLAERTTKATKEIADMIRKIQSDTSGAVVSMNKGKDEVEKGKQFALKAGQSLNEIISAAQNVGDIISQVAAASEQQSSTAEQISKNIDSINSVIHESAQGVQQIATASEDLSRLTLRLQEMVAQFKVDKTTSDFAVRQNGKIVQL